MDAWGRQQIVDLIGRTLQEKKTIPSDMHDALLTLAGDSSSNRARAGGLRCWLSSSCLNQMQSGSSPLLSRKAGDLRRGVITLITGQKDTGALASAERLLTAPESAAA